tara:strand:+ start:4010 stop:4180 length:171 start_codon:yes stop_codon:yes gene_type:complete
MKLTPTEKRKLLARFIEHKVSQGYDISGLVGRSLNYFDWVVIYEAVKEYDSEFEVN